MPDLYTAQKSALCALSAAVAMALPTVVAFVAFGSSAAAGAGRYAPPAQHCEAAAQLAARSTGVPLDVLRAIALAETGRGGASGLRPWAWTVNMEGAGHWFPTEAAARAFVYEHFKRGARSFDIGCFQINYKWHGHRFRSIDQMFQPEANARYAAAFLKSLYAEFGTWSAAAGAYHSRTSAFARRYTSRFETLLAQLSEEDPPTGRPPQRSGADLETAWPLIVGASPSLGSLVPSQARQGRAARALIWFK